MSFSVPPPEPPAIVQTLPPEASFTSSCKDARCNVFTDESSNNLSQSTVTKLASEQLTQDNSVSGATDIKVTPGASLLGPSISVGHKLQPTIEYKLASPEQVEVSEDVQPPIDDKVISKQEVVDRELPKAATVKPPKTVVEKYVVSEPENLPIIEQSSAPKLTQLAKSKTGTNQPLNSQSDRNKTQPPIPHAPEATQGVKESQKPQIETTLQTKQRGGGVKEFDFSVPQRETQALPNEEQTVPNEATPQPQPLTPEETTPQQQAPAAPPQPQPGNAVRTSPFGTGGVIELTADRQQYDEQRQIITAEGNVVMRFQQAILDADRIQVNLPDRIVVAEGDVALRRGEQVLRGSRFEYYFVQDSGNILSASGEIYVPRAGTDFSTSLPTDVNALGATNRPLSDRVLAQQPLQGISSSGGYNFVIGSGRRAINLPKDQIGGTINRLRFQAEKVDFDSTGWRATNLRITNDPFSPPELELRADTARFRNVAPLVDEITTTRSRVVFDQGLAVPTFRNKIVIDRREREPPLFTVGYDSGDRGGLFIQRGFEIFSTPTSRFTIKPEFYVQKAFQEGDFISPSNFGLRSQLDINFSPRTTLSGNVRLLTLDPTEFETKARASVSLNQIIGTKYPHTFNFGYSYRERIFNGSLGFRTVQSSLGAFLSSPIIPLGNTGINFNYQAAAQYINADTDRPELLEPDRKNNRAQLYRYQGNATLTRGFLLWQGKALPATPTEGLRYTPTPVVPYLSIGTGITGVLTAYSSGDTQNSVSGNIGLYGQFGHFSRPYLDYTGFNINYSQVVRAGESPFLFDRQVDDRVLSGGITQQLWGPFRVGFQTAINLDNGQNISTDYFLEYSRRAYNIILRYNPILEIGSLNLRVNDFNWVGSPQPFDGTDIRPTVQGVTQ